MIISKIVGGLGNQMFCYAAARRLAHRLGAIMKLDLQDYRRGFNPPRHALQAFERDLGIRNFNISASEATDDEVAALRDRFMRRSLRDRSVRLIRRRYADFLWPASHVREKSFRFDEKVLKLPDDCYLTGFRQSEKYFVDAAQLIRQEFTFCDPEIPRIARAFIAELKGAEDTQIVSVHIRRGDLAYAAEKLGNRAIVHGPPITLEYVRKAMATFSGRRRFLVFSDSSRDIAWCREQITENNVCFSEGHTDILDFAIMRSCDHHIIANSAFSWWAAWLNEKPNKRIVAPKDWFFQSASRPDVVTDDLIPASWETL